jgi:hypothetical protein
MADSQTEQSPASQVEVASKAFEQEFERFARFSADSPDFNGLDLDAAIAEERSLAELRTRHLGKKSVLAGAKKLIGRVASDERAAFGQLVQSAEAAIVSAVDRAQQNLKQHIEELRTARACLNVIELKNDLFACHRFISFFLYKNLFGLNGILFFLLFGFYRLSNQHIAAMLTNIFLGVQFTNSRDRLFLDIHKGDGTLGFFKFGKICVDLLIARKICSAKGASMKDPFPCNQIPGGSTRPVGNQQPVAIL